jgi:hypothetical protein
MSERLISNLLGIYEAKSCLGISLFTLIVSTFTEAVSDTVIFVVG